VNSAPTSLWHRVENLLESLLFGARWLLAPLYVGLIGALALVVLKFGQSFVHMLQNEWAADVRHTTLGVLELLDITLLGNLVLLVMFVGYENFVSRLGPAANQEDRPHWMGRVGFSGLKLKLIGSLVAISVIELLKDFLGDPGSTNYSNEGWRIGLHITFVISGLLFAATDWMAANVELADAAAEKAEA
jgi:uncharacterized protein (TIGR00645 family)